MEVKVIRIRVRRGQRQKWSKCLVGQKWKATSKVRAPDWQPIPMENRGNVSVGKIDWKIFLMGRQGNRKEKNPEWKLTPMGNSRQISVEQPNGQTYPTRNISKVLDWQPPPTGIEGKEGVQRGQQQKRSKNLVGHKRKSTRKVRVTDYQPIPMVNSGNESVGNPDWRPSPMRHKGNRKEKNIYWNINPMNNRRQIRVEHPNRQTAPMGINSKAPY